MNECLRLFLLETWFLVESKSAICGVRLVLWTWDGGFVRLRLAFRPKIESEGFFRELQEVTLIAEDSA